MLANITNTAGAILKFQAAATDHATATEVGDYKTANKNYSIIIEAVSFLKNNKKWLVVLCGKCECQTGHLQLYKVKCGKK